MARLDLELVSPGCNIKYDGFHRMEPLDKTVWHRYIMRPYPVWGKRSVLTAFRKDWLDYTYMARWNDPQEQAYLMSIDFCIYVKPTTLLKKWDHVSKRYLTPPGTYPNYSYYQYLGEVR